MKKVKKFYKGLRNVLKTEKIRRVSFSLDKQDPRYTEPILIHLTQEFQKAKTIEDQEKILQKMVINGINPISFLAFSTFFLVLFCIFLHLVLNIV